MTAANEARLFAEEAPRYDGAKFPAPRPRAFAGLSPTWPPWKAQFSDLLRCTTRKARESALLGRYPARYPRKAAFAGLVTRRG